LRCIQLINSHFIASADHKVVKGGRSLSSPLRHSVERNEVVALAFTLMPSSAAQTKNLINFPPSLYLWVISLLFVLVPFSLFFLIFPFSDPTCVFLEFPFMKFSVATRFLIRVLCSSSFSWSWLIDFHNQTAGARMRHETRLSLSKC